MFWAEIWFFFILSENVPLLVVKISIYLNRRVFLMFRHVRPTMSQISLGIGEVWSIFAIHLKKHIEYFHRTVHISRQIGFFFFFFFFVCVCVLMSECIFSALTSRKHAYIALTPETPLLYTKTGVYMGYTLFFLFLLKIIDCGYSLEPPRLVEAV